MKNSKAKNLIAILFVLVSWTKVASAIDATNLPCGIGISVTSSNCVQLGNSPKWTTDLTNASGTSLTCIVSISIDAVGYNGQLWTNLCSSVTTNPLASGGNTAVCQSVAPTVYASWPGATLRGLCVLEIQETNEVWFSVSETGFVMPANFLSILPAPPVTVSTTVTAQVNYPNPYTFPLQGVVVHITADEVLSTNASITQYECQIGTVGTNQSVSVSTNFVAGQCGTGHVWVTISGSNLTDMTMCSDVPITE